MTGSISWPRKLLYALLILLIFTILLELFLRLVNLETNFQNRFFLVNRALDYPEVFLKDRNVFWRLRPDQTISSKFFEGKTYHINSLGLRGPEIPAVKTKPRILTLGNSCTFGWGMSWNQCYPSKLEKYLDGAYEVIDGGIPGYTSYQGKKLFKKLLPLKPDIVTIMFAWNDHWAAASAIADKDQKFPPDFVIFLQNNLSRLHIYRLLKKLLLSGIEKDLSETFNREKIVYRVGLEDYHNNLVEICRTAFVHDCRPILLTSPIPSLEKYYQPGAQSPMHEYHELYNQTIRTVAAELNVELIDLDKIFDHSDEKLWDDVWKDPVHFDAAGHDLAARTIAGYIENHPE